MFHFDPISLIERGYAVTGGQRAWVRAVAGSLVDAAAPGTPAASAFLIGPRGPEHVVVARNCSSLRDTEIISDQLQAAGSFGHELVQAMLVALRAQRLMTYREFAGTMLQSAVLHACGAEDLVNIIVEPMDYPPVLFSAALTASLVVEPAQRAMWRKLTAHLAAGCRLSERQASPEAPDVECILSPEGKVLDARSEAQDRVAREQLRVAVQNVDRARTRRGRADPEAALELWQGLFAGRWSLVDHFESGGKRYLLARRNVPEAATPAVVSLRQRQVLLYASAGWSNKEIGYALGIAEATVAAHLRKALRTLGMSRADWVRVAGELSAAAVGG